MTVEVIYLASPYSHADPAMMQQRYGQACEAVAALARAGVLAYSPIAHSVAINDVGGLSDGSFEFWRAFDLGMVERLDRLAVLTLPGWQESRGVAAEIQHAILHGKPITYAGIVFDDDGRIEEVTL